ncbi:hypothetical protein GGR58DRAFT_466903 [Xylaria digitata]|nr:hypothetical protein GGR58DRAFT_466903 [Xylaria digitata]
MAAAGSDCVATLIVGKVYCTYWIPSKSWYAAVVHPTGGFESIAYLDGRVDTKVVAVTGNACRHKK